MRRSSALALIFPCIVAASMSGCASTQTATTTGESSGDVAESREVTLRVDNNSTSDVVIYLVGHGAPQRIGMVNAVGHGTFALDMSRFPTGDAQFVADPVGGLDRGYSGQLNVHGGTDIVFTIQPIISQSSAVLR